MRVSLVNVNLVAHDAIGQCMVNQIRYFRRRGDEVQVYVLHPPQGIPEDVSVLTRVVSLGDLVAHRDSSFARSDLYVYHYPGRYPLVESIKGIERGAVILYYHNVTPPEVWASTFEQDTLRHSIQSLGSLVHYADLVVADSPFNADQLVEEHGCERNRIRVLPLAVALEQFSPGPREKALVEEHRLEGRRVILFVGRMAGNKRIDLLVEALSLVQRQVPNTVLLLVGDDQGNPAIREVVTQARTLAMELDVAKDVIITGVVDPLFPYYRLADVYVTASLHEGFGVPLIEAMASGVPVVASRITAHPWVVGEAGLLAEPDDATDLANKILQVLSDDGLRGDLVRRGLARAREFSLESYETGWARIVADATAWLPDQPYPRPRSLLAQLVAVEPDAEEEEAALTVHDVLLKGNLGRLEDAADVMMRDYTVRSKMLVVGPLVAWLRRNLTSHLREPYVDPTFERQVAFNQQMVQSMRRVLDRLSVCLTTAEGISHASLEGQQELESRLSRIEAWLSLMAAQVSLLEAERADRTDDDEIVGIRQQIDALRSVLEVNRDQEGR
jgi:glycosyltransferase involved in cell wall biosynthesis